MTTAEAVGTAGVTLLLCAFALNLAGRLSPRGRAYQGLNLAGAGLACASAWMIGFLPFVVLEGTWAAVAAVALLRPGRRPSG